MKRVLSLSLGAVMALGTLAFVAPDPVNAACPGGSVRVFENSVGGGAGDSKTWCTGNYLSPALAVYDLNAVFSSGCSGGDWNDCISSVEITGIASCHRIYFWNDKGYTTNATVKFNTARVNISPNDAISSIKLYKVC